MQGRIRIEINGKDAFWEQAFEIEWRDQFPDRALRPDGARRFLVEETWLADLERVAAQTFCRVTRAPENPQRRQWMRGFFGN